eukprot:scaffold12.g8293.t1
MASPADQGQQQGAAEELARLKAALEQLGEQLEEAGGMLNEEGEPVVDIREAWQEDDEGPAGTGAATAAHTIKPAAARPQGRQAEAAAAEEKHAGEDEEDFEALMQRMEQLQWDEEQAERAAAAPPPTVALGQHAAAQFQSAPAGATAGAGDTARPPVPARQQRDEQVVGKAKGSQGLGGRPQTSVFTPGFLLGKRLDPAHQEPAPSSAPAAQQPTSRGPQLAGSPASAECRRQQFDEKQAANAAFTGRVVERGGGEPGPTAHAADRSRPRAPAGSGDLLALKQQEEPQPRQVSRFKQRLAGGHQQG